MKFPVLVHEAFLLDEPLYLCKWNDNDIIEICYELTDDKFSVKIYDTSTGWGSIPHTGFNPPLRDEADKILFISLSDISFLFG